MEYGNPTTTSLSDVGFHPTYPGLEFNRHQVNLPKINPITQLIINVKLAVDAG
ncbi:hypothetical protein SPLC1_S410370 [Arthrospira platensis C1]|nr:hypothetical protein SPLC1_S410370 [Arthrospira platensis C1]